MKDYLLRGMFVLASLIPAFGCSPTPSVVIQPLPLPVESENRSGVALNDLPAWNNYRVDPYIQAVAKLQSLGKEGAGKALAALAVEPDSTERELKVLLLCRLLFAKKPGQEFRSPMLGIPVMIGESAENAWPLEPFEVVDGIPLRITRDYQLGGAQEHPVQYLRYCLRECEWSGLAYRPKTEAEKTTALEKLLASPKWKVPLASLDREFLADQLK